MSYAETKEVGKTKIHKDTDYKEQEMKATVSQHRKETQLKSGIQLETILTLVEKHKISRTI